MFFEIRLKIVIIIQRIRWIVLYYNEPRKNPFCFISFIVNWFYDCFSLNFLKHAVWKMQRKQILLQPHITKLQFVNNDFANEFCGKLPNAYSIIFPKPTHFWALMSHIKYLHFYTLVFLLYAILPFLHIIEILIYSIAISPSCFLCDVTPQEKKIIYVSKTAYIAKKFHLHCSVRCSKWTFQVCKYQPNPELAKLRGAKILCT